MKAHVSHPVVVLGGGIAGITAALELNRAGVPVALVEKSPFFGGRAASFVCKATDVCQKCGACRVDQALRELFETPEIRRFPHTQVMAVSPGKGGMHLTLVTRPQAVDPTRCTDCGLCLAECPVPGALLNTVSAENHPRFAVEPARCLFFQDGSCRRCEAVCPTGALDLTRPETRVELTSAGVVVATGYQPSPPPPRSVFARAGLPQVITGGDLEELLRQGGPLFRPSDGRQVRRLAFIQCVGSRDREHAYCSRVCCGYGLRLARLVRHRWPEVQVSTFYMDLQNVGPDPEEFEAMVSRELELIRALPGDVALTTDGSLMLRFFDDQSGKALFRVVDLLVLAVGIAPGPDNPRLAEMLGLPLTADGFLGSGNGAASLPPGIFLAGTATGPLSIPECITQATRAAQEVCRYLEETL
ncbi:MAG: FAD-dependent oxidoreductase [Syntrophobacterales bacterium]|nr:FAD-dependent oxidoreductase [Syntrophobacterales bacterium]